MLLRLPGGKTAIRRPKELKNQKYFKIFGTL
jgi:hypothetical protein